MALKQSEQELVEEQNRLNEKLEGGSVLSADEEVDSNAGPIDDCNADIPVSQRQLIEISEQLQIVEAALSYRDDHIRCMMRRARAIDCIALT